MKYFGLCRPSVRILARQSFHRLSESTQLLWHRRVWLAFFATALMAIFVMWPHVKYTLGLSWEGAWILGALFVHVLKGYF